MHTTDFIFNSMGIRHIRNHIPGTFNARPIRGGQIYKCRLTSTCSSVQASSDHPASPHNCDKTLPDRLTVVFNRIGLPLNDFNFSRLLAQVFIQFKQLATVFLGKFPITVKIIFSLLRGSGTKNRLVFIRNS